MNQKNFFYSYCVEIDKTSPFSTLQCNLARHFSSSETGEHSHARLNFEKEFQTNFENMTSQLF